jgi:hypothetical protein
VKWKGGAEMATTMQTDVAVLCEAIYRDPSDLAAYAALSDELEARGMAFEAGEVLAARDAIQGQRLKLHSRALGYKVYTVFGEGSSKASGTLNVYEGCTPIYVQLD